MRIMTKKPLNAETPIESMRSWITDNEMFFKRNQGAFPEEPVDLSKWELHVDGRVDNQLRLSFEEIRSLPKVEVANTLECSGNGRSLLEKKAHGNPWTIGGVGNAVWGGIWLKDVLRKAGFHANARHVSFEGFDQAMGSAGIQFVRSIPMEKALSSTLLAYEMNGQPLPLKHGYPLRALALGWTGANCVKWLKQITVRKTPFEGFFMDKVYRVFQKGEESESGTVVTDINVKSIIVEPTGDQRFPIGVVPIRGAAYAGKAGIASVEVSVDDGANWKEATLIGPEEAYAWRHWEYLWDAEDAGTYKIMVRAEDKEGQRQPETAQWNKLGYGNNGIREHGVRVTIGP
jgi:DMSO/TMAO reductase YedYZ molybdopterin-dependent catalytic subunit